jgi:AcrR family transcriptional regulator
MARPRTIDLDRVLDAGERVVMRDGASNLTLDAVAAEAGISKGSVLYDCKSKHALIKAIIERKIANEDKKIADAVAELGAQKNAEIRGRIAVAADWLEEEAEPVALQLCSALAQDEDLQCLIRASLDQTLARVADTSENPGAALVALLALEGLRSLHLMGFHKWSAAEFTGLLAEIERVAITQGDRAPPA